MDVDHDTLVAFAKSFGLIYLIVLSVGVTVYAFWPSLGGRFDRAAKSVLDDEEGPWR
jgi:cytochrome c oxidase cbb3-type subunit 4